MSEFNFTLYENDRTFSTGLGQLTTSSKRVDELCHSLLVSAINLACPANGGDRNVDRVRRVLERFPASSRRKAAIHWAKAFAPLTIKQDSKKGLTVKMQKDAPSNWDFNTEAAFDQPFWEFSNEKDPAPIEPLTLVKNAARSIRKAMEGKGRRPLKGDPEEAERIASGLEAMLEA